MEVIGEYIEPGTRVVLQNQDTDTGKKVSEFGVVVHCWLNRDVGIYDCYVAFFGNAFPEAEPTIKPYVLRYASKSLNIVEGRKNDHQ
ncbi:MAG: hypothetical protein AAGD92_14250 [Pseudomonadota bacterium]